MRTKKYNPLFLLILVAIVSGFFTGIIGGAFHFSIDWAYQKLLHFLLYLKSSGEDLLIPPVLIIVLCGATFMALARYLVRLSPDAAGSGIQHVEAVFRGLATPAPLKTLPVKFIGGLLAMAPGSALGREGPTVQMAAIIGTFFGKVAKLNIKDQFTLYTAVAGSGLAVAFNAPLAGAIFGLEEVSKKINLPNLLISLSAVGAAIFSLWLFFGNQLNFQISVLEAPDLKAILLMTLLGFLSGIAGVFYNKSILRAIDEFNAYPKVLPEIKAAIVGSIIGLIVWNFPEAAGGGEIHVQQLINNHFSFFSIALLLCLRWIMGPISYSAGTPGGLFAPILLVGACLGSLFGLSVNEIFSLDYDITPFILVGMASLFASVVRAPLTGIILVTEMTGSTLIMVPLLLASVAATMAASLLKQPPIYDSLLKNLARPPRKP